jgi:hypothetical protein
MLLFGVGKRPGKNQDEAIRIDCRFDRWLDGSGQHDLDGDITAVALHLELFDLSRAAGCILRSAQRPQ